MLEFVLLLLSQYMLTGSIFKRVFLSILLVSLAIGMVFLIVTIRQQTASIENALTQENKLLGQVVAQTIEIEYLNNLWPLEMMKSISDSEEVLFLWVVKPDGQIFLADDLETIGEKVDKSLMGMKAVSVRDMNYKDENIKLIIYPLNIAGEKQLWNLFLGVSLKPIVVAQRSIILSGLFLFLIIFISTIIISAYLTKGIANPLNQLEKGVEIIGKGDLDYKLQLTTGDEIERLANEFNNMTGKLKSSYLQLDHERIKVSSAINSLTDGLIMLDTEKKISIINPRMLDILEVSENEVMGKNLIEIKNLNLINVYEAIKDNLLSNKLSESEISIDDLVFQVVTVPVFSAGRKLFGQMIILHDVTREKNVEKMKTEFVSLAAHQLRTPLSSIKWTLKMLLDGDIGRLTKEQQRFINDGYQSNERMIDLVGDLLNVTEIEEGRFLRNMSYQSIEKIIEATLVSLNAEIKEKKIKVVFEKPVTPLPNIKVDGEKITLAIRNILDNAIRYNFEGGKVTVSTKYDKLYLRIIVADTGKGIPKNQQRQLFNKFFRASNAVKSDTTGTGLGLFICRNIIRAHGGDVIFQSEEDKGTTFEITLPVN